MDPELKNRLDAIEQKLEATYISAEKTRKYFLVAAIISVAAIVLPLVGLVFAIPSFLADYSTMMTL